MRDDFCVGVGLELGALRGEFLAQLAEILDDAVMHDGDALGRMGMGVGLVGPAVGRPSRVRDPDPPIERLAGKARLEVLQLALGAAALEMTTFERGYASRIIAAVLEPLERIEEMPCHRLPPQNSDDSAHEATVPAEFCPDACRRRCLDAANAGREITMHVGVCQA